MFRKVQSDADRFASKYVPEPNSGCWLWLASIRNKAHGYGQFHIGHRPDRKKVYAHRFSYELHVGPIPESLTVDHLCRVRSCVNPRHLEPVTIGENLLRGETFQGKNAAKTHCIRGHELAGTNLLGGQGAHRRCKICHRETVRRRRERLRAG
jgi:hypothetical protein